MTSLKNFGLTQAEQYQFLPLDHPLYSTTSLDILKDDGEEASNPCRQMSSCDDCIRHPECAWCADPDWDPVIHRHAGKFKLGGPNKIYTTYNTDESFELNEMKKTL